MDEIVITKHAVKRFLERSPGETALNNPATTIRKLLLMAVPEKLDPVQRVVRLINNGQREAEYLVCSGWRFVLAEGTLLTCERVKQSQN